MRPAIYEIVEEIASAKTNVLKTEALSKHSQNVTLKIVLDYIYNKKYEFLVPATEPPFKKSYIPGDEYNMYNEAKRLRVFVKGNGYDHLKSIKRENLYIGVLEYLNSKDAELVLLMPGHKKIKGISESIIREVWPDLLPSKVVKKAKK